MLCKNIKVNNSKVLDSVEAFFKSCLVEKDVEKTLSFVADDIYSLGTGAHDIATNKEEYKNLLIKDFNLNSKPMSFEIINYTEKNLAEGIITCICDVNIKTIIYNNLLRESNIRVTATFFLYENEPKICNIYMSPLVDKEEKVDSFPHRLNINTLKTMHIKSQAELSKLLMESISGGVVGFYLEPNFPLYSISDELLNYLGYTYEDFINDTKGFLSNSIHHDDLENIKQAVENVLEDSKEYEALYRMKKKDGSYIWVFDKGKKVVTENERLAVISIIVDITETVELQKKLLREATLDSLTQVYNRKEATNLIELDLKKSKSRALLLLDIENFKKFDDSCENLMRDDVLVILTSILKSNTRENDIIARVGGDEFIVYLKNMSREEDVINKANTICKEFKAHLIKNCKDVNLNISIGGVLSNKDNDTFINLYRFADMALYDVKLSQQGNIKLTKFA